MGQANAVGLTSIEGIFSSLDCVVGRAAINSVISTNSRYRHDVVSHLRPLLCHPRMTSMDGRHISIDQRAEDRCQIESGAL